MCDHASHRYCQLYRYIPATFSSIHTIHLLIPVSFSFKTFFESFPLRYLVYCILAFLGKGVAGIFHWQGSIPKGRRPIAGAGFLGGSSNPSHQLGAWGALWAPQLGSVRSPDRPKFSTIFSTQDGLSYNVVNVDYHAAIRGQDTRAPFSYAPVSRFDASALLTFSYI